MICLRSQSKLKVQLGFKARAETSAYNLACWSDCLYLLGQECVLNVTRVHVGMYISEQVCF